MREEGRGRREKWVREEGMKEEEVTEEQVERSMGWRRRPRALEDVTSLGLFLG